MKETVRKISVDSVGYQIKTFIEELYKFTPDDFSNAACTTACLFFCIAKQIENEVWSNRNIQPLDNDLETRIRDQANIIRELYSYVQYLNGSNPQLTPPEIQIAIQEITKESFSTNSNEIVALVSPTWEYNLIYDPISLNIEDLLSFSTIDFNGKLNVNNKEELINKLWRDNAPKWEEKCKEFHNNAKLLKYGSCPPKFIAGLSFAGLDKGDTLMYPILAHELGHFFDYSSEHSTKSNLFTQFQIPQNEVENIYKNKISPTELVQKWEDINSLIEFAFHEILADLIGVRTMGLSFFIGMAEFLKTSSKWPQSKLTPSGYPGIAFRLQIAFKELLKEENNQFILKILNDGQKYNDEQEDIITCLREFLEEWAQRFQEAESEWTNKGSVIGEDTDEQDLAQDDIKLYKRAIAVIEDSIDKLQELAEQIIPNQKRTEVTSTLFQRIKLLDNDLPPFLEAEDKNEFAEIMTAAWVYQLKIGDKNEKDEDELCEAYKIYQKTCRLVFKAIELISIRRSKTEDNTEIFELGTSSRTDPAPIQDLKEIKGALNDSHIIGRMEMEVGNDYRLSVVPKISKTKTSKEENSETINESSLDIHLGNWFAHAKKSKVSEVDLSDKRARKSFESKGRSQVYVPFDDAFIIHPGDFVLGTTLEFFRLPKDLMAFVEGKSSIGRLGLFIATATQVGPDFKGVIVLELANAGTVPLALKPGMPIAQLVFQTLTDTAQYKGGYSCQTKPNQ